jgi:hypothetical protein
VVNTAGNQVIHEGSGVKIEAGCTQAATTREGNCALCTLRVKLGAHAQISSNHRGKLERSLCEKQQGRAVRAALLRTHPRVSCRLPQAPLRDAGCGVPRINRLLRLRVAPDERDKEQHQENHEEYLRDCRGCSRQSGKPQRCGQQRHHQKNYCPMQHAIPFSLAPNEPVLNELDEHTRSCRNGAALECAVPARFGRKGFALRTVLPQGRLYIACRVVAFA